MKAFSHQDLNTADLIVDAIYEGGSTGTIDDDPLCRVLPGVGNQGGFRSAGRGEDKKLVVLYTSGEDKDWPDRIDLSIGQFVYYGDNKTPGHELHDTRRTGNRILRRVFELLHASPTRRDLIPPFFVFAKHPTRNSSRSVQFKGLAVPGFPGLPPTEDVVAVWKTSSGQRFQNYRAVFTILDVPMIDRLWIVSIERGVSLSGDAPPAWREWVNQGRYHPLVSEPTTVIRSVEDQTPDTDPKARLLTAVFEHFKDMPFQFEAFAARIFQMQDQRAVIDEITRNVVDGGRDAIGRYRLGLIKDPVQVEFALEAKCYAPPVGGSRPNTVGVKEVSRLISRIRDRQFGVLVTTSVVARQAYQEVREDRHPIIFIVGRDIAEILISNGYNTRELVRTFLESEFPHSPRKAGRQGGC